MPLLVFTDRRRVPRYDYRCPECGEQQELVLTIKEHEARDVECRACKVWCEPVPGAPAIKFIGSGWTPKGK